MTTAEKTVHDSIREAQFSENVELIDVSVEGAPIVLLRSKAMPKFAFVMWTTESTSTQTQLVFNIPNASNRRQHPVVCACCSSERRGLECPKHTPESQWVNETTARFKEVLVSTALTNGISTLFMRRAHAWDGHYGRVDGLAVVEAANFREVLQELYGRKHINEAFRFIDESETCW